MGFTLAGLAIFISTLNACAALVNFVLSRIRLPRVRYIGTSTIFSGPTAADGRTELTVDVLNYGAAIWDLELRIEVFIPPWLKRGEQFTGTRSFALEPVGKTINPLNSGQAMEFVLSSQIFQKHRGPDGKEYDDFAMAVAGMKNLPRRYVSLCVYSNGKRNLLKRIRSKRFLWAFNVFFNHPLKLSSPWRTTLSLKLFRWRIGTEGKRIRAKVDEWRLGYFDFRMQQIESLIQGEYKPPDRVRLRADAEE